MIVQNRVFYATSTNLPLSWSVVASNNCISFLESSGTSETGYIDLEIYFQNESCFNGSTITLVSTDQCGRSVTNTFTPTNNCPSTTVSITQNQSFGFQANVTPPGNYSYDWHFNTDVFELAPTDDSANGFLDLNVKNGTVTHDMETIVLRVQNTAGCTIESVYNFEPCIATTNQVGVMMSCVTLEEQPGKTTGIVNRQTPVFGIRFFPCFSRTINWATLEFSNVPQNVFPINLGSGNIIVYANTQYGTGTPLIKIRVKDSEGIWSEYLNLAVHIPECQVGQSPVTINDNIIIAEGSVVGDSVTINLENLVASRLPLDWSTFTFIEGPNQTLNSSASLSTPYGDATVDVSRNLSYEITALPTEDIADVVKWRISDEEGSISKEGRIYVDFVPAEAPVATNDSSCAVCGQTKTIQPLSNDTGVIDNTSFVSTQAPTKGAYQFNYPDLSFTPNLQSSGSDTLKYKISNPDGIQSNEATITYTIVCAGESNSFTTCKSTVDFTDYLSSWSSAGGSWSASLSNPDTISLGTPTAVNFAGKNSGVYEFTYSVSSGGCGDSMTLTVTVKDNSSNDECADAITMSFPGPTTVVQEILTCDSDSTLETVPGVDTNPVTWASSRSGDVWLKFNSGSTANGILELTGVPYGLNGARNLQAAIYSGGCTIDTFTILFQAAKSDGSQTLTLAFEGLTASTQYFIRLSTGEYNGSATGGIGKFNVKLTGV